MSKNEKYVRANPQDVIITQ